MSSFRKNLLCLSKRESFCLEMCPEKEATQAKRPRNRKPPHKHSVNQFDFDDSEEEILSVSCYEEEINAIDSPSNKILATMIEKELLAQVFGLDHNHQYVYGRKVILYTDHKPLVSISSKPLAPAPKCLQSLLLHLQRYDAEIRYRPGRETYLADTLSRAYLSLSPTDTLRSETENEVESIHAVDYLAISEQQLSEIKQETAKDPTLQILKNVILRGWPESSSPVPKEVSKYFNVRDELAIQDGIIFKGQRCVIPRTLRQKVREKIHRAHIGIQGCLRGLFTGLP